MTPCTHRGLIAFHLRSYLCGSRGAMEPVYRCKLHVICTHRKYRHGQTEQVCLACDDYQPQQEATSAQDQTKANQPAQSTGSPSPAAADEEPQKLA